MYLLYRSRYNLYLWQTGSRFGRGDLMNVDSFSAREDGSPRNEVPADQPAARVLHDDFALLELDKRFAALLLEISAARHEHGIGAVSRQVRECIPSDEAIATRQIESVLGRLEPIEQAIMDTPARTIAGLGVKARHAAYLVSEHWDAPIEQIDWDARAVRLLIEAVCKAAGVLLPFAGEAEL
jgi:hypothetical protein